MAELKRMIHDKKTFPPEYQRLVFGGKQLEDGDRTLGDYNVNTGHESCSTLYLVMKQVASEDQNQVQAVGVDSRTIEKFKTVLLVSALVSLRLIASISITPLIILFRLFREIPEDVRTGTRI